MGLADNTQSQGNKNDQSVPEDDPLDAFFADIDATVAAQKAESEQATKQAGGTETQKIGIRTDIQDDDNDDMIDYIEARKKTAQPGTYQQLGDGDSDDEVYAAERAADQANARGSREVQYDEHGHAILPSTKSVAVLTPVDHSTMQYQPFKKDFYVAHGDIVKMTAAQAQAARDEHGIRVSGGEVPKLCVEFKHACLSAQIQGVLDKKGYTTPTPIQMQGIPALLKGRDVMGLAKTGSGKTLAFVIPLATHCAAHLGAGGKRARDLPLGLIVAPVRELAEQIYQETKKFMKPYGMSVCPCYGGLRKYDQVRHLQQGVTVVVATPGRLIEVIKQSEADLRGVQFVVIDEADTMLSMGFEQQLRSILGQIRPDRQLCMFSATMPKRMEALARTVLTQPVRITVGAVGVANEDVQQEFLSMASEAEKLTWLTTNIPSFVDAGEVLVFVNKKMSVETLHAALQSAGGGATSTSTNMGVKCGALHGDMDQYSRSEVITKFKASQVHVLVATDVAARGLDITNIQTVVIYEASKDIETHVHRVGRVGRAGDKGGRAFVLLSPTDGRLASQIIKQYSNKRKHVPEELQHVAEQETTNPRAKKARQVGGAGLGFTPATSSTTTVPGFNRAKGRGGTKPTPPPPMFSKASTSATQSAGGVEAGSGRWDQGGGAGGGGKWAKLGGGGGSSKKGGGGKKSAGGGNMFVSAGTTESSIGMGPTIVAPKQAASAREGTDVAPPPVPIAERPLYWQQQAQTNQQQPRRHQQQGNWGGGAPGIGGTAAPQQDTWQASARGRYDAVPPPPGGGSVLPTSKQDQSTSASYDMSKVPPVTLDGLGGTAGQTGDGGKPQDQAVQDALARVKALAAAYKQ